MKIKLTGRYLEDIEPFLDRENIELVDDNPDIIIAHGGDGTLLGTDREFPDIPKVPIRDQRTAQMCSCHNYKQIIDLLLENKLRKSELVRIRGNAKGHQVIGINDVFIHNLDRMGALRYRVFINDELYAEEVVGDAVGVATVHGSTAYYRSITHSIFRIGIGLAFSNSTQVTNHLVLPETSIIRIQILRGPAIMVADNGPDTIRLEIGSEATISTTEQISVLYGLDIFMCNKCRERRHLKPLDSHRKDRLAL